MIGAALLAGVLLTYGQNPEHEPPPSAVDVASVWIGALRDGRAVPEGAFTSFPFTYREAWADKRCSRSVPNADLIGQWIDCVHEKEGPFISALLAARKDPHRLRLAAGLGAAGKRLRSLAQGASGKSAVVSGAIKADDRTYEFVLTTSGSEAKGRHITGMFIDATTEK
jgi:hypothetical protein